MNEKKPNPTETIDTFIAAIPVGEGRCIVVHRRQHAGREHLRFRYWIRHHLRGLWYPDSHRNGPRAFTLPLEHGEALANALLAGVAGEAERAKPGWLVEREQEEAGRNEEEKGQGGGGSRAA